MKASEVLNTVLAERALSSDEKVVLVCLLFAKENNLSARQLLVSCSMKSDKLATAIKKLIKHSIIQDKAGRIFLNAKVDCTKIASCNDTERIKNPVLALKDLFFRKYKEIVHTEYAFKRGEIPFLRRIVLKRGSNLAYSMLEFYCENYAVGRATNLSIADFQKHEEAIAKKLVN